MFGWNSGPHACQASVLSLSAGHSSSARAQCCIFTLSARTSRRKGKGRKGTTSSSPFSLRPGVKRATGGWEVPCSWSWGALDPEAASALRTGASFQPGLLRPEAREQVWWSASPLHFFPSDLNWDLESSVPHLPHPSSTPKACSSASTAQGGW